MAKPSIGRFGRRATIVIATAALFALWGVRTSIAASTVEIGRSADFPRPAGLEPNVKFWVDVFSAYSERDFIIHDRDHIWRIYQVLRLPGNGAPSRSEVDGVNNYLKEKYSNILNRLASGQQPQNYEERQVAGLFKGEAPSAYALAAQNLRVQQGMREQYRMSLLRSRYYRPTMEEIFAETGLPPELVALATVESGFYSRARSDAGAVGIWQFTRGTGRQFMRITRYHDDRLDPRTETEAAAKLLRSNFLTFGNWPLAITAYNYGTAGMAHASDVYNGDYAHVLQSYDGPHFGFATKNYYAEFLAALQIDRHVDAYFPNLKYDEAPPPPAVRTDLPRPRHHRVLHRVILHRRSHHRTHTVAVNEQRTRRHGKIVAVSLPAEHSAAKQKSVEKHGRKGNAKTSHRSHLRHVSKSHHQSHRGMTVA